MAMQLTFSVESLVAAEKTSGKSLPEMLAELESEIGASVTTVQALVLAGIVNARGSFHIQTEMMLRHSRANELIEKYGIPASIAAIGAGLKEFTERRKEAA